ncbi:MAG: hydroxyacylglutathione hydrolase, partial [Cyanobacteria bacterium P01_F01_bin.42]
MQIFRIPVLSDNYSFLLHDPARSQSIVVDPGSANPVLSLL